MTKPATQHSIRGAAVNILGKPDTDASRKWLLAQIDALEREKGPVFPRKGTGAQRYIVLTEGLLRHHMPWLFDHREEMREEINARLQWVSDRFDDIDRKFKVLAVHEAQREDAMSAIVFALSDVLRCLSMPDFGAYIRNEQTTTGNGGDEGAVG